MQQRRSTPSARLPRGKSKRGGAGGGGRELLFDATCIGSVMEENFAKHLDRKYANVVEIQRVWFCLPVLVT